MGERPTRAIQGSEMATSIHNRYTAKIADEFNGIAREHITPWFEYRHSGVQTFRHDGSPINLGPGLDYGDQQRRIFLNGYVQPFVVEAAAKFISEAAAEARAQKIDVVVALNEVTWLLITNGRIVFDRMALVDRRLRGNGFPEELTPVDISPWERELVAAIEASINRELLQEKVLVSSLLLEMAGKAAPTVDTFSGWLMAGSAAAVSFIISKNDPALLSTASVQWLLFLLVLIVLLGIAEKGLAAAIAAVSASAVLGRDMGTRASEEDLDLSQSVIFDEALKALFWPGREFARRLFKKTAAGDYSAMARMVTKAMQVQYFAAFAQALLVVGMIITAGVGYTSTPITKPVSTAPPTPKSPVPATAPKVQQTLPAPDSK